jgi:pre-mRNA-splicing factor 38A
MANVTDPLARSVHGTNPQNLIEYITRQKIYDSLYWKEECFGLSASDVATKATELKALGGSYGGNNKPTRFLCLALKLLQIQPEEGIVEEFLQNEDFKYVRALGAFYLRLTGRPAEIYELIEPLYNDFRKLRFRESTGWKLTHMDELADELLTKDRYCGIALPHLPKRDVLVNAGYLDGPRPSALLPLMEEQVGGDAEKLLERLAENGNAAAKVALDERRKRKRVMKEKELKLQKQQNDAAKESESNDRYSRGRDRFDDERDMRRHEHRDRHDDRLHGRDYRDRHDDRLHGRDYDSRNRGDERYHETDCYRDRHDNHRHHEHRHSKEDQGSKRHHEHRHKDKKSEKKYGSLFKSTRSDNGPPESKERAASNQEEEHSEEYWNEQRAKLGLKPLQK